MKDQHRGRHGGRMATCLPVDVGSTLLLAGCGDRSVSGSYVAHAGNLADLLQITETPDHHFAGTIRYTGLNSDGTLSSSSTNVSGSVDGIDLSVANGPQTGVEHFTKGQPSDFDAEIVQLNRAGQPVIAARQRGQRVDQLNRQVNAFTNSINSFVASAHRHLERLPRGRVYYEHAVTVEQAKLDRAQRLEATGNGVAQGQAGVIVGQMGVDKSQISIVDDNLDCAQNEETSAENSLNARIAQWRGTCLDVSAVKVGDLIPDMGPCKALSLAVAAYKAVRPPLHTAFASAVQARSHGHARLATIWQAADQVH